MNKNAMINGLVEYVFTWIDFTVQRDSAPQFVARLPYTYVTYIFQLNLNNIHKK